MRGPKCGSASILDWVVPLDRIGAAATASISAILTSISRACDAGIVGGVLGGQYRKSQVPPLFTYDGAGSGPTPSMTIGFVLPKLGHWVRSAKMRHQGCEFNESPICCP